MRKSFLENRKAAMEMSIGTIVTIVLLVSVLILGIFFISRTKDLGTGVIEMTDDAITKELNKLFAEPQKVMIYPNTRVLEVKQETSDEVGVVITNLIQGGTGNEIFSYKVELVDKGDCTETEEKISSWITLGRENPKMLIAPGDSRIGRVTFKIPTGTSLCRPRFDVSVFVDGSQYGGDNFDIQVRPK